MGLTIVMACFGQPKMLEVWWQAISSYDPSDLKELSLILVDDHGDPKAEIPKHVRDLISCQLFRIDKNIPWNQPGARNLGMHHAEGWCVMLDPDMVIPRGQIKKFIHLASISRRGQVTKFALRHLVSGRVDMTSPNTFMIHAGDFSKCGGYDEDYSGNKGWSDVQLQATLKAWFKVNLRRDLWVDFYHHSHVPDAQVLSLDRKVGVNKQIHLMKNAQSKRIGWVRWSLRFKGKNLRFPWTKVPI